MPDKATSSISVSLQFIYSKFDTTTVGNLKLVPQVHHRCGKHSRMNFRQNRAALPPLWLQISTVFCRTAAGLLEQEIAQLPSQREGSLHEYLSKRHRFVSGPPEPSSCLVCPALCLLRGTGGSVCPHGATREKLLTSLILPPYLLTIRRVCFRGIKGVAVITAVTEIWCLTLDLDDQNP